MLLNDTAQCSVENFCQSSACVYFRSKILLWVSSFNYRFIHLIILLFFIVAVCHEIKDRIELFTKLSNKSPPPHSSHTNYQSL